MEEEESNMGFTGQKGVSPETTQRTKGGIKSTLDPFFFRCYVDANAAARAQDRMNPTDEAEDGEMGIQSQMRQKATTAIKRKQEYQYRCYQNKGQKKMTGKVSDNALDCDAKAFDPSRDCIMCYTKLNGLKQPHRGHHVLCPHNRKTKGHKNKTTVKSEENDKKLAATNEKPFTGTFFNISTAEPSVREYAQQMVAPQRTNHTNLHDAVRDAMADPDFVSSSTEKKNGVPLPIMAVTRHLLNHKEQNWFSPQTLEFQIPVVRYGQPIDPHYHSIEGQRIYNVCWEDQFPGIVIPCPDCDNGTLRRDRSNFSKNKKLFPIFNVNGPPDWAIVMSYKCSKCPMRYDGNSAKVLMTLPIHVRSAYPVEPKFADNGMMFHLDRACSHVLEENMLTYGNADKLSRSIYAGITNTHLRRFTEYLSEWKSLIGVSDAPLGVPLYPELAGEYLPTFPPSGDSLRDLFDRASTSTANNYGVSDKDRCIREIQSVTTSSMFAQDHTMEVAKNYKKSLGIKAVWDSATETGEIASAVCVEDTKTKSFAHAAECLARRKGFNPVSMYSDTWPKKCEFWKLLFGDTLEGRLGLYHFQQRIIKTMRQGHRHYHKALNELLECVYGFEPDSYNALLKALKAGQMGRSGPLSPAEILEMQSGPEFRRKYSKFLMKQIHPPDVIAHNLQRWMDQYKGDTDPSTGKKLFTVDTKTAVTEQMKNAVHIQDALPLHETYRVIKPTPSTKHECNEYISLRCESKVEQYHDQLAHFANCGMRADLCDTLNLVGTARYNTKIRHKIRMAEELSVSRPNVPSGWKNHPEFFNHSDLTFANGLAESIGYPVSPFDYACPLPEDNGERFFAQYLSEQLQREAEVETSPLSDRCYCRACGHNPTPLPHELRSGRASVPPTASPSQLSCSLPPSMECDGVEVDTISTNRIELDTSAEIATIVPTQQEPKTQDTIGNPFEEPVCIDVLSAPSIFSQAFKQTPAKKSVASKHRVSDASGIPSSVKITNPYKVKYTPPEGVRKAIEMSGTRESPIEICSQASASSWSWRDIARTKRPKAQQQICCQAFLEWVRRPNRNGRPPHLLGCPNRRINNGTQSSEESM